MSRKSLVFIFSLIAVLTVSSLTVHAQTTTVAESVLYSFDQVPSSSAVDNLIQASDGNLYGMVETGGTNSLGSVYKISPSGDFTVLYNFTGGADGMTPVGTLVEVSSGTFYGVAARGGTSANCSSGCGTIFSITGAGNFAPIYSFTGANDGAGPSGLILGRDGNLYGTTYGGGAGGYGVVFTYSLSESAIATLYAFEGNGGSDSPVGLIQGADGNFYGTTYAADQPTPGGYGTIFKLGPSSEFETIYTFTDTMDGANPYPGLLQVSDGSFYGTTAFGGSTQACESCSTACGTIFRLTPSGAFTNVYTFTPADAGNAVYPSGRLFLGGDGNIYGTTQLGNAVNDNINGTFYQLKNGVFTTLYRFIDSAQAISPQSLVQSTDLKFYGTSNGGGTFEAGTIYALTLSPGPPAPVVLTFNPPTVNSGESTTLTWKVKNAYSETDQSCLASVLYGATGAGTWTGFQRGQLTDGVYAGAATISPAKAGFYTYALTCGGIEQNTINLSVGGIGAPSTTTLGSNSPVVLGSLATLSVSVAPSQQILGPVTGSVALRSGNLALGTVVLTNGASSLNVATNKIPAGAYTISATYSGDSNYAASTTMGTFVVLGYSTGATLSVSPSTIIQGQSAQLEASVVRNGHAGAPTGSVTFYYGSTALSTVKLDNGTATLIEATSRSIPPGTYVITARYSGDSTDQSSISAPVDVTIQAAPPMPVPTATTLIVSPNPIPKDSAATLTATVKQTSGSAIPTGIVTFNVGDYVVGSQSLSGSGVAVVNASSVGINSGTYPVTASYSGDTLDARSVSAPVAVVVK